MHADFVGLAAAILSLVAFKLTYDFLRGRAVTVRWMWLGIGSVSSIPALSFGLYYLHAMPDWEWFYTFRSWRGTEALTIFLGIAAGALASLLPRWMLVLPLLGLVGTASTPYIKPVIAPLKDAEFHHRQQGDIILQSTSATCGPASLCNVLHHLGVPATEPEIARAAYTYVGGTEAWYLARVVRSKGLQARFAFRETFSPEAGLPAMVGVRVEGMGHFIAVLKLEHG